MFSFLTELKGGRTRGFRIHARLHCNASGLFATGYESQRTTPKSLCWKKYSMNSMDCQVMRKMIHFLSKAEVKIEKRGLSDIIGAARRCGYVHENQIEELLFLQRCNL